MGHVVEQRPDGQSGPERASASDDAPGREVEPAPRIDPEQLRQFQEFQQFLRFQEVRREAGTDLTPHPSSCHPPATMAGQLLPADPQGPRPSTHPKVPGWLRWLGRKLIGWLVFLLLLAIALTWAYNHFFGGSDDNSTESAARMGGGTYKANEILSGEPYEAVRQVYDAIAQKEPETNTPLIAQACGRFDTRTQQRFAQDLGYPDCRQAVSALHPKVTHVNDYAESIHPKHYDPAATSLRIDSCDFDIRGGPALGVFTVTQVELGQWLITGHEPGPRTCPVPSNPSPGKSSTAVPGN